MDCVKKNLVPVFYYHKFPFRININKPVCTKYPTHPLYTTLKKIQVSTLNTVFFVVGMDSYMYTVRTVVMQLLVFMEFVADILYVVNWLRITFLDPDPKYFAPGSGSEIFCP